ncbi:MAG: hypothetical protein B6I30_10705, partial [Desulfobacteraceae bacterium 4572_187]
SPKNHQIQGLSRIPEGDAKKRDRDLGKVTSPATEPSSAEPVTPPTIDDKGAGVPEGASDATGASEAPGVGVGSKPKKTLTKPGKNVKKESNKKAAEMSADELLAEWDRQAEQVEPQAEPTPDRMLIKSISSGETVDTVDVKPTAKQKAKEASDHISSAVDKFKQINAILGEEGALSNKEVDQAKWELIRPLLKEAWDDIVSAGKAGADFVKLAMENLSPKGRPYFEKFVKEDIGGEDGRRDDVDQKNGVSDGVSAPSDMGSVQDGQKGTAQSDDEDGGTSNRVSSGTNEEGFGDGSGGGTALESGLPEGRGRKDGASGDAVGRDDGVGRRNGPDSNHVIEPDDVIVPTGAETRIKANIKAIKLVKKLIKDDRNPTSEEKKVLAQYVGWGAFSQKVFHRDFSSYVETVMKGKTPEEHFRTPEALKKYQAWAKKYGKKLHPGLGGMLTTEEWKSARASTTNAHYTSKTVIQSMWDIAKHLGFKGGTVLEPAGGVGHFFGLMPQDIAGKSMLYGVEKDTISGAIFQKLYPQASIEVAPFEKSKRVLDNTMDLVITNVPFAKVRISDKAHPDYSGWSLHNYFFGRSLSAAKPGGIVLAVTSAWTMDAQKNGKIREYLANKADLLGAIRLPNTAFKGNAGTDVVTDILVLRKKDSEQSSVGIGQDFQVTQNIKTKAATKATKAYDDARAALNDLMSIKTKGWKKKQKGELADQRADARKVVEEAYQEYAKIYSVNEYFNKNPEMVLGKHSMKGTMYASDTYTVDPSGNLEEQLRGVVNKVPANVMGEGTEIAGLIKEQFVDESLKEGVLLLDAGGDVYLVENGRKIKPYYITKKKKENVRNIIEKPAQVKRLKPYIKVREATKDLIRIMGDPKTTDEQVVQGQMIKAFGSTGNSFLRKTDNEFAIVDSLEIAVPNPEYNVGNKKPGYLFLKQDIFTKRTIFPFIEPDSANNIEDAVSMSIIYKGGLHAKHIAKLLGQTNIDQVKKDIVSSGLGFIDPESGKLQQKDLYLSGNVKKKLKFAEIAAEKDPQYKTNVEALEKVVPDDLDIEFISYRLGSSWVPNEVINDFLTEILNVEQVTVEQVKTDETSRWVMRGVMRNGSNVNNRQTWGTEHFTGDDLLMKALNLKRPKVMVQDPYSDKRKMIEDKEASKIASLKMKELSDEFVRWSKTHDKWRDKLATQYNEEKNGTILRKQSEPNIKYYPNASHAITLKPHQKIAVARGLQESVLMAYGVGTGKTFIFITLSQEMKRIGTARKPLIAVHNSTIDQYRSSFALLYPGAKVLIPNEGQRSRIQRKKLLVSMATGEWDAIVLPQSFFNGLANDAEREAAYVERRIAELEGELIEAREEADSEWTVKDLIITATGTPISNTMAELWTMLRYVRPDLLEEYGVTRFDDFAGSFGNVVEGLEETPSGFKEVERFAEYVNGPELLTMFFSGADVRLTKDADLKLPKVKNDKPTAVVAEKSIEQRAVISDIISMWRAWENLPGREKMRQRHVPLQLYGLAKKAAVDLRLVDPVKYGYDPNSKLGKAQENIYRVWKETERDRSTQIVFLDLIRDDAKHPRFNSHEDMKARLVAMGIPADEILIFSEAKNEKAQEAYKGKMRSGKARVVIGSTEKLGIGIDIAAKMIAAHHVNVPDRPMDIEQRNGRIIRQGNENAEVEIFHYMTKDTLDSVMFDRLSKKQRFSDQVLTGEIDGRTFNDPFSEEQASFSEFAAAASGKAGKLLFEKNDLIAKENKYRIAETEYIRKKSEARRQLNSWPDEIEQLEEKMSDAEKALAELQEEFPSWQLENVEYKGKELDRKDFVKVLVKDIERFRDESVKKYKGMNFDNYRKAINEAGSPSGTYEITKAYQAKVGSIALDIDVELRTNHFLHEPPSGKIEFTENHRTGEVDYTKNPYVSIKRHGNTVRSDYISLNGLKKGQLTGLFNGMLKSFEPYIEEKRDEIKKAYKALKDVEVLSKKEFPYTGEIQAARQRISEIDTELIALERESQEAEAQELAEMGEANDVNNLDALLSMGPAEQTPMDPQALEELRQDIIDWVKDVVPLSVVKRMKIDLMPDIDISGMDTAKTEKQWAQMQKPG